MLIRKMTERDAEPLFRLLSDEETMRYLEPVFDRPKADAFLHAAGLGAEPLILAAEENGEFIGYVIFHDYDERSREIGWVLLPEYRGRGYASTLTEELIERAFSEGNDAVLECSSKQAATKHIAERFGFAFDGMRDGCEVYRLTLGDMLLPRLSERFRVRRLGEGDVEAVCLLSASNPLFYRFHPPFVTRESIFGDMLALPPGKSMRDKLYIGFFDGDGLAAIMDLILGYPEKSTAFIGLFMVDGSLQGKGVGSAMIRECESALRGCGLKKIRLAADSGNPQSGAFWRKNGFAPTGEEYPSGDGLVYAMEKMIT